MEGCAHYAMLNLEAALDSFRGGLDKCPGHPKLRFAFNAVMRNIKRTGLCFVDDVREAPGPDAPDGAYAYAEEEAADEAQQRAATAPPAPGLRAGTFKAGGRGGPSGGGLTPQSLPPVVEPVV